MLSSTGRWVVDHFRSGGGPGVDAVYARLPRQQRLLIKRQLDALNAALPDEFERERQTAAASWQEAGITPTDFDRSERASTALLPELFAVLPKRSSPYRLACISHEPAIPLPMRVSGSFSLYASARPRYARCDNSMGGQPWQAPAPDMRR